MPRFTRVPASRASCFFPIILGATALLLAACDNSPATLPAARPNTLRIVSSFPTKGPDALQSRLMRQAIDLAVKQATGALGNLSVEHIALDDGDPETGEWSRPREEENARMAADDPSVVAYIGPYTTGATRVALPITNRAGLLVLGPVATWPGLTVHGKEPGEPLIYYPSGFPNYARMMPADSLQADAAALWARDQGATSCLVLNDGSSYSAWLAEAFGKAAPGQGLQVRGSTTIPNTGPANAIDQIKTLRPDALFYAPSTADQAAKLARALYSTGIRTRLFVSDAALSDKFVEATAGLNLDNWNFVSNSTAGHAPGTEAKSFAAAFQARYETAPSQYAANAYDAAQLVVAAVLAGNRSRQAVLAAVKGTRGFAGASGTITFVAAGDRQGWSMSGYVLKEGRFDFARTLSGGN